MQDTMAVIGTKHFGAVNQSMNINIIFKLAPTTFHRNIGMLNWIHGIIILLLYCLQINKKFLQ
jgi:hypothetical protein